MVRGSKGWRRNEKGTLKENTLKNFSSKSLSDAVIYGAQNEAYMSRSAEKWVRGLCFNELGACD